jgi:choline dehydrogenase-like flavoprotein
MAECFRKMEDHALGADDLRGAGGPLHVSPHPDHHPLSEAAIDAGVSLGLQRKDDTNRLDQEGIGYTMRTIKNGVRVSAADAFLHPIKNRKNLKICLHTFVEKIVFEGTRAVGVSCVERGERREYRAGKDVIVSAGTIQSAQLLQLSGIGPADHLRGLGIEVVHDSPGVGENLREHWMGFVQHRVKRPISYNQEFAGLKVLLHTLQYLLFKRGLMATSSHEVWAFVKTRPGLDRPDAQIFAAPFSLDRGAVGMKFDDWHGMQLFGYPLRPESHGSVKIQSADPAVQPKIIPRYLTAEADKRTTVGVVHYMRRMFTQPALQAHIAEETFPGPNVQTDDEIVDVVRRTGNSMHHSAGTCKMGVDRLAVVDSKLRVRGVSGLRVVDASVMPTLVSGTPNAAVMAMAWRASDLILQEA